MSDIAAGLTAFMTGYEQATNSHDIDRVAPMIAEDATYWFSDGSHRGLEEIKVAIERTFATIHDEVYEITDLAWRGAERGARSVPVPLLVDGRDRWPAPLRPRSRQPNVIVRRDGEWRMLHEHLSS